MTIKTILAQSITLTAFLTTFVTSGCYVQKPRTFDKEDTDKIPAKDGSLDQKARDYSDKKRDVVDKIAKEDTSKLDDKTSDTANQEIKVDGAIYASRAFDRLTPEGVEIFYQAKSFVKSQKKPEFHTFAQPLMCTRNVSHIFNESWKGLAEYSTKKYSFSGNAVWAVPSFIEAVEKMGGIVKEFPVYDTVSQDKSLLIDFIEREFDGKLPAGAVIAGCKNASCNGEGADAHMAIIGDKNKGGDIMLYHNNWLRPNNLAGQRIPYMVSLNNFYDLERPRQWMPTPWLNLTKDSGGKITDIVSVTPELDDLDPLNGSYVIKVVLVPRLAKELENKQYVKHHSHVVAGNPNTEFFSSEKDRNVCRSNVSFSDIEAKSDKNGLNRQDKIYEELSQYQEGRTFRDYNFEFEILSYSQNKNWVRIKTYDANRFWGSDLSDKDGFGEIWIKANQPGSKDLYTCRQKGSSY